MAKKYIATATTFKKVSGWTDGPCKPTITKSDTTASEAQSIITAASAAVSSLDPGESVNIVVQCVETKESN